MQFTSVQLLALLAPLIAGQNLPNAFAIPDGGYAFTAGESSTLNWDPTTDGTVTIILRSGASSNLNTGVIIADEISNSGSFTWTPDSDITRGSDYALEIVDNSDPTNVNYTPPFVIESDNTVASSTGQVTLGAPTEAVIPAPSSTLAPLSSASVAQASTSAAESVSSVMSASSESVMSSVSSMASSMMSSGTPLDVVATTASDSGMTTTTSTAESTDDASGSAGFQGETATSSMSEDAAPRVTAMAGLLGAVAVAAFAL